MLQIPTSPLTKVPSEVPKPLKGKPAAKSRKRAKNPTDVDNAERNARWIELAKDMMWDAYEMHLHIIEASKGILGCVEKAHDQLRRAAGDDSPSLWTRRHIPSIEGFIPASRLGEEEDPVALDLDAADLATMGDVVKHAIE